MTRDIADLHNHAPIAVIGSLSCIHQRSSASFRRAYRRAIATPEAEAAWVKLLTAADAMASAARDMSLDLT